MRITKYETPELEITKFEVKSKIMAENPGDVTDVNSTTEYESYVEEQSPPWDL